MTTTKYGIGDILGFRAEISKEDQVGKVESITIDKSGILYVLRVGESLMNAMEDAVNMKYVGEKIKAKRKNGRVKKEVPVVESEQVY